MSTDSVMEKFSKLPSLGEQTRGVKVFLKVGVSTHISVTLHTVNSGLNTERSQARVLGEMSTDCQEHLFGI